MYGELQCFAAFKDYWGNARSPNQTPLYYGKTEFFQWGLLITVRRSKTIQFQERLLKIPISRCPHHELCAVYRCEHHFAEIPASNEDISFQIPSINGSSPLTYHIFQSMLKLFGSKAGYDPDLPSSHSLRRGGCTFLSLCGATLEQLKPMETGQAIQFFNI